MWGDGVGCCALVSLFERGVCAWQGQQQLWTCWWGRRRPKGAAAVLHVPQQVCVHLVVARGTAAQCSTPYTGCSALLGTQPHLPGLGLCQVHTRWTRACIPTTTTAKRQETRVWVQPKTYHRHQVVLKTSEARSHGRYNIHRKAILTLSLQCPEIAPAPPCAGPLPSGQVLCRSGLQSPALSSGTSSLSLSDP